MTFMTAKMLAVVSDRASLGGLALHTVNQPRATKHQALVRVAAISLSGGEVERIRRSKQPMASLGSDFAGTVEIPAADGSGPSKGTRVVGLVHRGAWAEMVAVPSDALAPLPALVPFADAAGLPRAGLTALHGLSYGGLLAAKRVLITEATGDVGLLTVQLAQASSACVVAVIDAIEHEVLLKEYGADHVIVRNIVPPNSLGPYHLVTDTRGVLRLEDIVSLVRKGGTYLLMDDTQSFFKTTEDRVDLADKNVQLHKFSLFQELAQEPAAEGLRRLLTLVERHTLQPHIEIERHWTDIGAVADYLIHSRRGGRAVLHI